jgi:DNA-binding NarL/FixJ family response regulator
VCLVRILIVDDTPYWRKFLLFLLRADPQFEIVGESSDGLKAIEMAEQLRPAVVLMDVGLPGLDGLESAKRIRLLLPETKIVFVSQETDPDIIAKALRLGASEYVLKTGAGSTLIPAIRSAIADTWCQRRTAASTTTIQ